MGVMLALSAVFAVVITAISIPSDDANAQIADENTDATAERAEAWWTVLSDAQRTNALLGKEYDADTTNDNDDPAPPRDLPASASSGYPALATTGALTGSPAVIGKDNVDALVDGAFADPGDIYAVGEHLDTTNDIKGLRGFQSVELWWMYLDCTEARVAVGEDNNAIDQTDQDTVAEGLQPETSAVCTVNLNEAGNAVDSDNPVTKTAYADLDADTKALADKVGQAVLGLDAPGSPSSADNARAEAWWNKLNAAQMVAALYGDDVTGITPDTDDPATADVDESVDERHERAQAMYDGLDTATKTLVNDRWQWIYNEGGANSMGTAEVVYWWNSIGCAAMNVAVGLDNDVNTATTYCAMWDALNPDTGLTPVGQARQARVLEIGQAVLGISPPAPDVAAWWNLLSDNEKVYVVYGNPPTRTDDPATVDDTATEDVDESVDIVTDDDKAVFQKAYGDLASDDGIRVATGTALSTHLLAHVTAMLGRNGMNVATPTDGPDGEDADTDPDYYYYSAKAIVDAIANEIFDPPETKMAVTFPHDTGRFVDPPAAALDRNTATDGTGITFTNTDGDDNEFDWPYTPNNEAATVGDWWERTDCRVMRIAVGEDNQYLNAALAAVEDDTATTDVDESRPAVDAEKSDYCGHFPGTTYIEDGVTKIRVDGSPGVLSKAAQATVEKFGRALLGLGNDPGRFTSNEPPTGTPTISGIAQVGARLTADASSIADVDGLGTLMYQWLRDGDDIPGATSSEYTLQAADIGAVISVRVSFTDDERQYEMVTSSTTSIIAGSPGEISKIEPGIRGVTVSAGERVVLSVNPYGLQGVLDPDLDHGSGLEWSAKDGGSIETATTAGKPWQVVHTARSSPGTYTVVASFVNDGDCVADLEDRDTACTADFVVRVRRAAPPQPVEEAPVNPPGEIPSLLSDDGGNQYEVFTPVEGGTFDSGEGYSITAPSGAVPNGEFIGVRMSDDGPASNVGMTHQRYTLGGNMYGVHAVDSSEATVSSYVLDDPANVCVPLPDELRTNISDLALVVINSDGSLTILAANVHIGAAGTSVCGNLSNLPASVAVGSQGAPAAIPTATPEPEPVLPDTGATAPSSNSALWALILGIAIVSLGTLVALGRRRNRSVSR